MQVIRSVFVSVVFVLILSGCSSSSSPNNNSPILSTEVKPLPGDTGGTITSGLWPKLTRDELLFDLVWYSDTIVIATVVEILPAQWRTPGSKEDRTIYQDVILEVEQSLYGQLEPRHIVVQVKGGRIGDIGMVVEDEPVFTLGESSLLFLIHLTEPLKLVSSEIEQRDYYRVGYSNRGKCNFKNGETVYLGGDEITLKAIKEKITEVHPD